MINTKWPRLIVVGEPVTPEQADDILIRTNNWSWFSTNDRAWEATIERAAAEITGRPREALAGEDGSGDRMDSIRRHYEAQQEWEERMGILRLNYLRNGRIASAWIGGAHGWCDWSGRIGCDSYNIGKWPGDEEVTEDWTAIASAFPYLDLTAQCVEEEGLGRPAAEWRVQGGGVEYNGEPTTQLAPLAELTDAELVGAIFDRRSERGVSEERLRSALTRVAQR